MHCYDFHCVGQISHPSDGNTFVVLPGQNVTLAWKIHINISDVQVRSWRFLPKGNSFAGIVLDQEVIEQVRPYYGTRNWRVFKRVQFRLVFQICRTTGIVKTGENLCNVPVYSMLHNMVTLPIRNSPPPPPPSIYIFMHGWFDHAY